MEDFVIEYLVECQEGLGQFESELIALERDPGSQRVLSSIFRIVHSIKGGSGFLGFPKIAAVAHEGEDLLGKLREGTLRLTPAMISGLLAMSDAMRAILGTIEATRSEGERDDSALIARLRRLQHEAPAPPEPPPVALLVEETAPPPSPPPPPSEPTHAPTRIAEPTAEAPEPPGPAETTIRVDVSLLDKLMNLVGELVLTRNQILRCTSVRDELMLQASAQRLNLITTEIQEGMLKTRMQPIRNIGAKLPRVIRDLALACGKQARLAIEGEETELDKTIIEAVKDPITHIIRNAIDHGIEPPEVRVARGKPAEGLLRLRAYHEGGMVNIEVSDDGAGIDPARLRRKALERGWLTDEQAARWSDRELIALVFRPGFSTAEALTMVSGRGVGMDVVKNRVESIGGSIDLRSKLGEGTTIKLKIPLTLTIVNALIVKAGGDRFAIPQVNLVELVRLHDDAARRCLASIHGASVYRDRGKLLPLLDLNEILAIDGQEAGAARDASTVNIVVLQADQRRFGLLVDAIDDAQEIVVRPLARQLKGIACLAGATIMGDGRIALILDAFGIARQLDGGPRQDGAAAAHDEATAAGHPEAHQTLLLLRATDGRPVAIPLAAIDRLEAIAAESVEWVAGRPLVQYRGTLLPLIDIAAEHSGRPWREPDPSAEAPPLQVVIPVAAGRPIGLVFDRVLDTIEARLDVRDNSARPGVLATVALRGRATEILDVPALLRAGSP